MKTSLRRAIAAVALAAAVAFIALIPSSTASAACPGIKLNNNTPCDLLLCFYNAAGGSYCQTVLANSSTPATWPAGFMPIGVTSAGGTNYPWGAGCTPCISVGIPGTILTCCVMVCPSPATCSVNIGSCPSPCLP